MPNIPQHWKDLNEACMRGESHKSEQDIYYHPDGSYDYLKWEVRPWYTDDNQIGGIIIFTEVITDVVNTEIELHKQIQIQEMMIENLPDFSIVLFDHDLRIMLIGGDTLRKNGHDFDMIQGKMLHEVVSEDVYQILLPYYRRALNGESFFFERRSDRTGQILHSFANPIKDQEGRVIAGLMTTQDVTSGEALQQLLEFTEVRFHAIFNNTFQFIGFMTPEGILLEVNEAALAFAGLREEDVVGKLFWETKWWSLSLDIQERLRDSIQKAATGEFVRYEVDVVGKDDAVITIDFSIKPVFDANDKVIQLIPEGRNITDMVLLREELERSNNELQNFAYIASHDLQEPLRMVTSFLNLLKDEYDGQLSDDADQYIDFAVDGAQRMKQLIQDLLSYSRISTQGDEFADVDIDNVLQNVLDNLAVTIHESDVTIICNTSLPTIKGDKSQLTSLFQNLISNAIKFQQSDQQPIITIAVEEKGAYWQFEISDNGIGIDPKFYDRIFTIFQRLHNRTDYAGTGIGLAMCKKIVERHSGTIWLESKLGEGSKFYFLLPIIVEKETAWIQ